MFGYVRVFDCYSDGRKELVDEGNNLTLYGWADAVAACLAGRQNYHAALLYFEYENLSDPNDPVVPPQYDRSGGLDYYKQLSCNRDYLRVPLTLAPTIIATSSNYLGNQVTFFGMTAGVEGMHGLPFSWDVNSAVFGYAIVAAPKPDDPNSDIVISRTYRTKQLKQPNRQVGIQWTLRFD